MTTVLATKLYIPPARPTVVRRTRLIERLNDGVHRKLTLISAPAGSGKTTLLSEWLTEGARPAAWVSLDDGDNDPARFLTYLVAALRTVEAMAGEGVVHALQSSQSPPTEVLLTELVNELAAIRDPFVLVLDDYHVIHAMPVDQALRFLVEHLPPSVHLVIATREDPRLPMGRLRARDDMAELRAADLRFTPDEASAFLSQVMGLSLASEDIAALESRTEGWIAGLQLAALSLRGREDASAFVRVFAGDHRYVVDYLVEEVLQRQPESVRSFLLQTAILERLSGPLCDAVSGQEGGAARLEALERGNFFVVALDDQRLWYRYHHLFADMLAARLQAEWPVQVATLHRRASAWFEQHDFPADAIHHALASDDCERAADLIERAVPALRQSRQEATLLGWLKALPDEVVQRRPVLSVGAAWAMLSVGELEAADARLRDAEWWLQTMADTTERSHARPAAMVVVDEEEFRRLPASVAVYRAALAQLRGDVPNTVKYARQVLDLLPEDDHLGRGAAAALLGLASWASGDLETAHRTFASGIANVQTAGNLADAINGAIALAEIRIAQGRLREAMRTLERALQLAMEQGEPAPRGTADLYVGMSELCRERNDLQAAMQHLLRSKELSEHAGLPQTQYRRCVVMARVRESQDDLDGALELFHEAERVYVRDFFPNVRPVAALVARVWVKQGRLDDALGWMREQGLEATDEPSYLRECEHITLARVLLSRYRSDRAESTAGEAVGLLERLLQAAEAGGRTGSIIEILVLLALAHQAQGDVAAALTPLRRALALAEPEGYVRMFVDEGPAMAVLLEETANQGIMQVYAGRLLGAFGTGQQRGESEIPLPTTPVVQRLIEPLTQRELDVLRLFTTELSGPEIADELVIALSTVRTHTKSIYSKLNVTNRRAAVKRAAELELI